MTVIISMAGVNEAFQVIDRRVSVPSTAGADPTIHDGHFNKTVLVRGVDGLCSCSFTGIAYLQSTPMDQVIAESIVGASLNPEAIRSTRLRLPSKSLWELLENGRARLEARLIAGHATTQSLQVDCVGLQSTSRGLRPFGRRFKTAAGEVAASNPLPRHDVPGDHHLFVAGAGNRVLPDSTLLDDLRASDGSNEDLAALVSAVRRASDDEPSVGPDVMFVQIIQDAIRDPERGDKRLAVAAIGFDSHRGDEDGLLFAPWSLGPKAIHAPAAASLGKDQKLSPFLNARRGTVGGSILDEAVFVIVPHPRKGWPKA